MWLCFLSTAKGNHFTIKGWSCILGLFCFSSSFFVTTFVVSLSTQWINYGTDHFESFYSDDCMLSHGKWALQHWALQPRSFIIVYLMCRSHYSQFFCLRALLKCFCECVSPWSLPNGFCSCSLQHSLSNLLHSFCFHATQKNLSWWCILSLLCAILMRITLCLFSHWNGYWQHKCGFRKDGKCRVLSFKLIFLFVIILHSILLWKF